MRTHSLAVALIVAFPSVITLAAEPITVGTLLGEMTDLKRLASFPEPAYTCKQFSSWDRASTGPEDQATWYANKDAAQYLRVEERDGRKEYVMADTDGPGTIVRIWSANPQGVLRVYLDGAGTPAIEQKMNKLLGGDVEGFPVPLAGQRSRGWNLYFPIPYAKHLKVTSDNGNFYYHVNYRTYPAGTPVRTFEPGDLKQYADAIAKTAAALKAPRYSGEPPKSSESRNYNVMLMAGEDRPLMELTGGKAIVGLRIKPEAENIAEAVRGTILTITFDGEKTVECPVGDFFAMAPGMIPYASLPLGVVDANKKWGWSYWVMPFQKSAVIRARNTTGKTVMLDGMVATTDWKWDDRSLLFHAKWRMQRDIPTRPFIDWPHLHATGKGRFVGGHLHYINAVKGWWGEGDEKIFVDGEKFPSTFGTGTEDYYGYAWGNPERFTHAYHNQPHVDGPGTYGNVSNNRFHIFDDIPFTTRFQFDMEQWQWAENKTATRAAVSYWYARPGGTDFFKPLTAEDVRYVEVPAYVVRHVPGAQEGERLTKVSKTGGDAKSQGLDDPFSGEAALRWDRNKVGDRLVMAFEAPAAGTRHVFVQLVKASDFGIVQLTINDQPAGTPIDCHSEHLAATGEIDLGALPLQAGRNTIGMEVTGSNPKAKGKTVVGLDYVRVE